MAEKATHCSECGRVPRPPHGPFKAMFTHHAKGCSRTGYRPDAPAPKPAPHIPNDVEVEEPADG